MLTVHEVLCYALAILEERGWGQDDYCQEDGRLCILGAMKVAVGAAPGKTESDTPMAEAGAFLEKHLKTDFVNRWNDESGRTFEEVQQMLIDAIAATAPAPPDPFVGDLPLSGNGAQHPGPKADIQKVVAHRE